MSSEVNFPAVSIIMPIYDSAEFIEETLESVINQTFRNWELIAVDDDSTDESHAILERFQRLDSRIRILVNGDNQGAAAARNHAILEARGKYLSMLDSDDIWDKEKLAKQLEFMQTGNLPFSYTGYSKIDENGNLKRHMKSLKHVSYRMLLKADFIGTSTVMYDCQLLGKYMFPDIRRRQDYGMWMIMLKELQVVSGLPERLVKYRVRKKSLSGSLISRMVWNWRLHRNVMNCSFPVALYRLTWNIFVKIFVKP